MSEFFKKAIDRLTERRRDFIWSLIGAIISLWIVASCLKASEFLIIADISTHLLTMPAFLFLMFNVVIFGTLMAVLVLISFIMLVNPDYFKD